MEVIRISLISDGQMVILKIKRTDCQLKILIRFSYIIIIISISFSRLQFPRNYKFNYAVNRRYETNLKLGFTSQIFENLFLKQVLNLFLK